MEDDNRRKHLKALDKKRRDLVLAMFSVIGCYMVSIAFSLSGMAKTQVVSELVSITRNITDPLLFLFIGIVLLAFTLATLKMAPEE